MYQAQEQFAALNKANLEAATRFANVALLSAERLLDVQLKAAKTALADGIDSAKTLAEVKDLQQLAEVKDTVAQPAFEKAADYVKSVYEIASETQAEFGKLIEQQVAGFNKQFVVALDKLAESAPAGSEVGISALKTAIVTGNSAYENLSKAAKQFNDTAKSNLEAAAKRAAPVVAKKAKK
ncbi:MAG: phasin family protein [Betaproteobacteria bacterium]|nr:phasin family protein [Betaproteobacteria bacterium]